MAANKTESKPRTTKKSTPKRPSVEASGRICELVSNVESQSARTDQTLGKNYKKNMVSKIKLQAEHAKGLRIAKGVSKPLKYAHVRKYEAEIKAAAKKAFAAGRTQINESEVRTN